MPRLIGYISSLGGGGRGEDIEAITQACNFFIFGATKILKT